MPSEAQSQEPRDRGPPPPVTRAGRSAQLAKAAATSSAPERRPRGRPRKDGSGGSHSGPPAALPPAPPPPKPRKKGRSRGRAQVENEESMNITERNHPQKETETQEKTTGRRRSTTRRKSNTNPEPSPEPDPGPTDLDCPSVAEPHVEPVSSIEEEDRSCAALDPPPACGLGEDLQVSPMDLHHSPVPSPRHTPAHMAVDCSPRCVPMETEGANPTEQGPALSPCSSPPISPRPQLEDEDLPSPLFQRCLSEDSGGSPTPSLGHTEQRLKQCAFCYRGDELTLGQGRLVVFGPTPGYIPLHILNRRASSDRDSDCHDHCYQHSQAPPTCSSPEPCDDKSSSEFMEQLGVIGLPHDINVQSLFDFTGQCCAHLQCAAWSEGVCRGEGQSLLYVDKAIDSGSTQVCVFCHRLGASLRCQEVGCGRSYHFPCAAAAGAHQDWKKRLTLCTRHTHTVSPQCVACAGGGDVSSLLMCCCCGNHYHGNCLVPPLAPSSLCRAGWQCPQCRVCQSCRLRGDKGMLLVCERCDKSYHTHCLSPPLEHTPVSWSCKNCRVCRRCDVRSSGQWANHPFLCGSCDPALPCPLCGHAPNFNSLQDCVTCICCYRSVHAMCIGQARVGTTGTGGYICSPCRPREDELIPATQIPNRPTPALPPSPKQETVISTSLLPFARLSEAPPISPAAYSPVPPLSADFPKTPTTASQESLMPSPPVHSELHHTLPHASPCPLELQQSPVPLSPDPQELQQSASPLPPDPSELHQSPPPLSPNPPELQQSLAPSPPNSSELKQSPAPLLTYPIELIHSPPPVFPSPSELQQSPPPSPPDPLEFQQSPAVLAPYPIELNHSPPPPPLSPSELHQTKPSLYPNPSDLRQSPAPLPSCPSELQQSPAPLPSCPSELQKSPAPLSCSPIELQQNPPLLSPSPSDLHDLPLLSPIHTELQQNSEPLPLNPIELQNSPPSSPSPAELQNPPSLPLVITELQKRSVPLPHTSMEIQNPPTFPFNPTKLQESRHSSSPNPSELQHRLPPSPPLPSEHHHSPPPLPPTPSKFQNLPLSTPNPSELQQPSYCSVAELHKCPLPSHPLPTELEVSQLVSCHELAGLQRSPVPSKHGPILQGSIASFSPDPSQCQKSHTPSKLVLAELPQSPGPMSPSSPLVLVEVQQSPTHVTSKQAQLSPSQLSFAPCSPIQNFKEEHLLETECQESPLQGSPMSCHHTQFPHSPPTPSLSSSGVCLTSFQSGPTETQPSSLPHSTVQDSSPQVLIDRSCSPVDILPMQSQNSLLQRQHSITLNSPAQVRTPPPQGPTHTQDPETTLDQESPGSFWSPARNNSTLEQDLSSAKPKSILRDSHAPRRPRSAPCSPLTASCGPSQCSLSQPASPMQAHSVQLVRPLALSLLHFQLTVTKERSQTRTPELRSWGPCLLQPSQNDDGQTLESSSVPPSFTTDSSSTRSQLGTPHSSQLIYAPPSPPHGPAVPTPESLVHRSTSVKHSSLTSTLCAEKREEFPPPMNHISQSASHDSQLHCTEETEHGTSTSHIQTSSISASPTHIQASSVIVSPDGSLQACGDSTPRDSSLVCDSAAPAEDNCSQEPVTPPAPHVHTSAQPTSPSGSPVHPTSILDKHTVTVDHHFLLSETRPSNVICSYDSATHSNNLSVYSSPQFTQITQSGQSSSLYIRTSCSPSETVPVYSSPLQSPACSSPPHCRLTNASIASSSVCPSLGNVNSGCKDHDVICTTRVPDVSSIHSQCRSCLVSPVHIQNATSGVNSDPVQRQTPLSTRMTHSNPVHAIVSGVSSTHSSVHLSPSGSPHYSQAPDTESNSSLNVVQLSPVLGSSSPDVDIVACFNIQSSPLPCVVQLHTVPSPASISCLPDGSSDVSQVCMTPISNSFACPLLNPNKSAPVSLQSSSSISPSYPGPATHVPATSTWTSAGPSPVPSPTQEITEMPNACPKSEMPASPTCTLSQDSIQANSVLSSPPSSLLCCSLQSDDSQTCQSRGPTRFLKPEAGTGLNFATPMGSGISPGPACLRNCPKQYTLTEGRSRTSVDNGMTEEQEHLQQRSEEEEHLQQRSEEEEHLQQRSEEEEHLQQRTEEEEHLQQRTEEEEHLQQRSEEEEHLQQRTEEEEHLQQRTEEQEHLQQRTEEEEHLQQRSEEEEHLQQRTEEEEHLLQRTEEEEHPQHRTEEEEHPQHRTEEEEHLQQRTEEEEQHPQQRSEEEEQHPQQRSEEEEHPQQRSEEEEHPQQRSGEEEHLQQRTEEEDQEQPQQRPEEEEHQQQRSGEEEHPQQRSGEEEHLQQRSEEEDQEQPQQRSEEEEHQQQRSGEKEHPQQRSGEEEHPQQRSEEEEHPQQRSEEEEHPEQRSEEEEHQQQRTEEEGQQRSEEEEHPEQRSEEEEHPQQRSEEEEHPQQRSGEEEHLQQRSEEEDQEQPQQRPEEQEEEHPQQRPVEKDKHVQQRPEEEEHPLQRQEEEKDHPLQRLEEEKDHLQQRPEEEEHPQKWPEGEEHPQKWPEGEEHPQKWPEGEEHLQQKSEEEELPKQRPEEEEHLQQRPEEEEHPQQRPEEEEHLQQWPEEEEHSQQMSEKEEHPQQRAEKEEHPQQRAEKEEHPQQRAEEEEHPQQRAEEEEHPQQRAEEEEHLQQRAEEEEHLQQRAEEEEHLQQRAEEEEHLQQRAEEEEHLQQRAEEEEHLQQRAEEEEHLQQRAEEEEHLQQRAEKEEHPQQRAEKEEHPQQRAEKEEHPQQRAEEEDCPTVEAELVERTIGVRGDQEEDEDLLSGSACPPSGPHQSPPPHPAATSPLTFKPDPPLHLPASSPASPPVSPFPSTQFPTSLLPRAGSLEASPLTPNRDTLVSSCPCSPFTPSPLLGDCPQDIKPTSHKEAEVGEGVFCQVNLGDNSQSQGLIEPVAVGIQTTKDEHQSHPEVSQKEEEKAMRTACDQVAVQQPMREKQGEEAEEEGVRGRMDEGELRQGAEPDDHSDVEEEEPVSPVLDLDASLDVEVMELMTSSSPPPSLLHLPSLSPPPLLCRGKGRSLRALPTCSRPSDDLAIRLRQSPFSTEASPETSPTRIPITPPPLSPPSPQGESPPLCKAPPPTVLPLTPKIGMGKPAISKRKFSPGRARVRQGSWWSNLRAVSPPISSQDSAGEGGWDSPKPRPLDSPLWSTRVGRGAGFPGRRRSRGGGVGGGRGGRGRSRLKTQDSVTLSPGFGVVEPFQQKDEEENSMHNTVVMFSTSDHFTLRQDMCVVCGSFGQGAEGRLLACSQCGQCYHPYCVNVKITRVILTKGWRCLECTVCEACGEASDPGRLLLCDDCDISYHTYCLDPPLHTVPKGAWKCKWCVWCVHCGSTSPGLHCDWQSNYSRCGPCASLSCCPLCQRLYTHDDLILQCQQCDRWVHAICQGLTTEDEVEIAADEGFDCSLCRTQGRSSYVRLDSFSAPYMAQIISRIREPDTKTYTQDGVCLTESGLSHLQSLVEPLTSPRRYRRCKPKLKLRIINQNSVSVLQTHPDPDTPTEQDPGRGDLDCDIKSDSSPERDHTHENDITKEPEVTDGNKKRKRKPYRPGIGGFMVRQRGGKAGPSRIKLCRKDSVAMLPGQDEDLATEMAPAADQTVDKVKKRYRKKKTKLEEAFPSYLQEAFFGRDLLDRSQQVPGRAGLDAPGANQLGAADKKTPTPSGLLVGTVVTNKKHGMLPMSEDALVDLSDVLNTDPHILATGHTGQFQVERSPSPFAGLDISSVAEDHSLISDVTGNGGRGQRAAQEEPLDAILSPELDKMVTDGAILSRLYKIPELEGKDVEEVFTAVLSPNSSNHQSELGQHTHTVPGSKTDTQVASRFPRVPLMNGLMGSASPLSDTLTMPSGAQGPVGFRMAPTERPSPSLATTSQAPGESEQDAISTTQRGMLKWEKEETLGELATVAPVLYCNTNFPQLREQYPDWSTRVKQIAKLWRKASSQDRAPYVQKARDNRAAQRINKVQLANEPLKRHQPSQPPPQGAYDSVSIETDLAFRDPLRPKESEQEQEWKLRQGEVKDRWAAGKKSLTPVAGSGPEAPQMRQKSKQLAKMEATQKLEQVKNEQLQQQRQQQLAANQSPQPSVTGGNASPLHPPPASRQQSSGLVDDVFLRPQAPPPSGFSLLPHSPHPSSPLNQPPSSPQMFSPPSSRPSSPWDPYTKAAGTPRPASSQPSGPPTPQQQQRSNSLNASPAHDILGSPAPSPDSKTVEVSRNLGPQPGLQQTRPSMMSPSPGSAAEHPARHVAARAAESYVRTVVQGGVFKAPMPPQHQLQPEAFGSTGGGSRRDLSRPTDPGFGLPQSQDASFPSSPLSGLGSPHRSPYAQMPGTPRLDYSQQISDPFVQQSPLTSRPSPDPYSNPQTPGTPRPHSDPAYLNTSPARRPDQFNQPSVGRRPSPSHPTFDPYGSNPGTPRPLERFSRSPSSQRSNDPYAQPPGTPRPSLDPYAQQPSTPRPQVPVESFTPQPARSPLGPGLSVETVGFTPTHHQPSPGRPQQDSLPRIPCAQTSKHPGMAEETGFTQTSGHDPFEQGHTIPGPSQTDKTAGNDMVAGGVASVDCTLSIIPQLGDSEEKLRQRQRLRQLILRQQQQKSALRQEKGLQEPAAGPAPGSVTPHHWSQEDVSASTTPQTDVFGRPPPPYPGTVRPARPQRFPGVFPGGQQRSFPPNESLFPQSVRGPALRFGVTPGASAAPQDHVLRPTQASGSGSGLGAVEGIPLQSRRPMPGEFTAIRLLAATSAHPHVMSGIPQHFLPRSLPIQQHSIMGQPYIELRHRAPENRLRLPFSVATPTDPEAPLVHHRDPQPSVARPGQGTRMGETPAGQHMGMPEGIEDQQHLSHATGLGQGGDTSLPGTDGLEEHMEGEDSAVKDLEDVEVKDLVDLNLNLDPEDGKEDLDLGPNDLHLDDFLLSGKFDLIAYADPELNLEDKKDMFNEELDLGESVEDKEVIDRKDRGDGPRKVDNHAHLKSQVKQEVEDGVKREASDVSYAAPPPSAQPGEGSRRPPGPAGPPDSDTTGSSQPASLLLCKEMSGESGSGSGVSVALQAQEQAPSSGMIPNVLASTATGQQSVLQQRPFGPSTSAVLPPPSQTHPLPSIPSLTPQAPATPPHLLALQTPQPRLLLNPQTLPPHPGASAQSKSPNQIQNKPKLLLLEEQPLLLQDLLDQERQEQQQQKQMQALIRHKSTPDLAFPDMTDFDSISDPIMKAKMVALKGINKVMTQGNLGLNHMVINRIQQTPGTPETTLPPPHTLGQDGKLNPQVVRPNPPSFGSGFSNESQRRQYEEWLGETQQLLQMQQGLLEDQIAAHRKTKKALSAKQRTAKRAGRALTEDDAAQLRYITEQQGTVQKQLEQIRKQQKDHTELIEDYRSKQQRVLPQPTASPSMSLPQTLLSQPQVPRQPHPVGPASACVPTVPASWLPGGGTPGVMGQRMPPALPTPSHTQVPPQAMVAGHAASSAGFTTGVRGPAGRPTGATGDGGAPPPQVKFDDNNPFSEGFQERERRERLKEQQERQRVQLMQEVERHRVLQQRLEREQQDLLGAPVGTGALLGPTKGPGGPTGPAPGPRGDGLAQMPFFSSELPQDFLQSSPASRTLQPSQVDAPFPQQGFSEAAAEQGRVLPEHGPLMEISPRPACPTRPPAQGQVHPLGIEVAGMTPSQAHRFGHESLSSSPSAPRPPSFPSSSSAGPTALVQLYPDIIPDDKPKKKKNGRRDGDDTVGGARTPLSSHSDDLTAPPTPAVSDTSCSTPTRAGVELSDFALPHGSSLCGLAPLSDLERQQAISSAAQEKALTLGTEAHRGLLSGAQLEVKQEEHDELGSCGGGIVKMEECGGEVLSSPLHGGSRDGDGGKELLRHLLKEKTLPSKTPSPTSQIQPPARQQLSVESIRSEGEDGPGSHGYAMMMGSLGRNLLNSSGKRKPQRCKRAPRPDKDKGPPKYKRRKREEEEEKTRHSSSSPDQLMTHLRQLSVLPLMEPVLGVDLSLFPPYGSSCLGRDSRLTGSFGNACLDGVTDYYSHLIYKQNNLSNPPTPPASLPPTPPPIARQKLLNGFATVEELSRKDLREQDVKGVSAVKPKGEELLPLGHASKTVDVPASLPTPPHNNQEELRVQDTPGHVSPDGFIPSSSPESVTDMEVSRYPDFSFIKLEPASACPSPPIPIMPCAWGKGSVMKQEVKVEPNHQGRPSCSNTDLVTMTITLNPLAAQNVPGVMATVAELLQVPVPMDYQLSRASGPSRSSLVMLAGVQVPLPQVAAGGRPRPPAAGNSGIRMDNIQYGCSSAAAPVRPQFCSSCKVLLGNGVRIIKELKQEGLSPRGTSLVFCSPNCSALYTSSLQSRTSTNKSACERSPPSRMQHQYTNNMSSISVHSLPRNVLSPPAAASSSPLHFPSASTVTMEIRPRVESLKVKVKLKPHPRAISGGEDSLSSRHGKRMKNSRWRRWGVNVTLTRGPCIPDGAVAMPTEEEVDVLLKKLGVCLHPDPLPRDQRRCCFCHQQGDGQTDGPARLLNLDLDLWVHLNCALWSSEVYETQAGALINVELALRRGLTLRCAHCQQTGATSGCNRLRCTNTYHFTCALQAHCTFFKDKTMLCHLHKPRMATLGGDRSSSSSPSSTPGLTPDLSMACDPYDSELRCFAVFRRVYVQRDEARQIAAVVQRGEQQHTFRVGSLLFHTVGRLLPHQMNSFHEKTAIYPMGYHANRIYWSMRHSNRRCKYMCYIEEANARPLFKVKVVEKGYEDLVLTASSPKGVWDQILEPVAQLRSSSGTLKLFPVYLKGEDLFGLTTSAVSRIIESLPGVEACERYTFRYGRNPLMEWPLAFNPSGSARSEPKACHAKRPYLLSSIASRCQGSVGSIVGLVPGVISLSPGESVAGAHQGRHSKSSQYRRMKAEWKSNVYLARSRIQGLGLYAARDIEKCTMVIEYIGTIIRSEVANRKERLYESQNRGVYMFRIDNDYVIDATITGGPARYINHSCAPNCITEVVTVEKENKIVISSCRRIQRGEELSYDYKFDLEDDQHKIPCHCGAFNCRKWMN